MCCVGRGCYLLQRWYVGSIVLVHVARCLQQLCCVKYMIMIGHELPHQQAAEFCN
jgi:hypothetical protein